MIITEPSYDLKLTQKEKVKNLSGLWDNFQKMGPTEGWTDGGRK